MIRSHVNGALVYQAATTESILRLLALSPHVLGFQFNSGVSEIKLDL